VIALDSQRIDELLVLFHPSSPSAYLACPYLRIILLASQPKERFGLFPLSPPLLAVFSRHDSATEDWADQLRHGINEDRFAKSGLPMGTKLDEYANKCKDAELEHRDGTLQVTLHTNGKGLECGGGPYEGLSYLHRSRMS
jgi:hypothetical protein